MELHAEDAIGRSRNRNLSLPRHGIEDCGLLHLRQMLYGQQCRVDHKGVAITDGTVKTTSLNLQEAPQPTDVRCSDKEARSTTPSTKRVKNQATLTRRK
jgi:hypothetical protein